MLGDVPFPAWQAHPDVWLLVALFAVGYALAVTRLGPRLAPAGTPVVTRFQVVSFSAGLLALWVASDWPIHDVAERYLFSVHMVQHVAYSIVAAPLLLIGTPTWLARWLLSPRWLLATVRYLSRFIPGDDRVQPRGDRHAHAGRRERRARARARALRDPHADLRVVAHRVDAAAEPAARGAAPAAARCGCCSCSCSRSCRPCPRRSSRSARGRCTPSTTTCRACSASSALDDMQIAGVVMKIGVGLTLWVIIAILFFRWYSAEEAPTPSRRVSRDLERELMGLRQP